MSKNVIPVDDKYLYTIYVQVCYTYLGVSELGECVDDDTEYDVQSNGRNEDEEWHVEECYSDGHAKVACHLVLELLK